VTAGETSTERNILKHHEDDHGSSAAADELHSTQAVLPLLDSQHQEPFQHRNSSRGGAQDPRIFSTTASTATISSRRRGSSSSSSSSGASLSSDTILSSYVAAVTAAASTRTSYSNTGNPKKKEEDGNNYEQGGDKNEEADLLGSDGGTRFQGPALTAALPRSSFHPLPSTPLTSEGDA
jgi:hypothetical protein